MVQETTVMFVPALSLVKKNGKKKKCLQEVTTPVLLRLLPLQQCIGEMTAHKRK